MMVRPAIVSTLFFLAFLGQVFIGHAQGQGLPDLKLSDEARLEWDTLELINQKAQDTHDLPERAALLNEFIERSTPFAKEHPQNLNIWMMRAEAALELSKPNTGWEAGQKLKSLGAMKSEDRRVRKVMALLNYKGWLNASQPKRPEVSQSWENTLGMKFVAVGKFHVCVWETRLRDFKEFFNATRYNADSNMYSLGSGGWKIRGNTWRSPGFNQTDNHPVVGVNWSDAMAFCEWLTKRERAEGLLASNQKYRLPTEAEWILATGLEGEALKKFPVIQEGQLKSASGNYAGVESKEGNVPETWDFLKNYTDGFRETASVGSFLPNALGVYDLTGNVWEWCLDSAEKIRDVQVRGEPKDAPKKSEKIMLHAQRGGGWATSNLGSMPLDTRKLEVEDARRCDLGFRILLETAEGGH
ncbi:MAG: formylglycine-generating enzyme family protein [Verrucomicrobiota bacterium]|nr:formylglycine-generating enzyme family protein [Verrucomicrobiota bacterium]